MFIAKLNSFEMKEFQGILLINNDNIGIIGDTLDWTLNIIYHF